MENPKMWKLLVAKIFVSMVFMVVLVFTWDRTVSVTLVVTVSVSHIDSSREEKDCDSCL